MKATADFQRLSNTDSSISKKYFVPRHVYYSLTLYGIVAVAALILAVFAVNRTSRHQQENELDSSFTCEPKSEGHNGKRKGTKRIFTIAAGHDRNWLEHMDKDGHLEGFSYAIVQEVCNASGIDCRTIDDPYTNCMDSDPGQRPHGGRGLMAGWYDGCIGWAPTPAQVEVFKFSQSFVRRNPTASFFVLANNTYFDPLNFKLNQIGFVGAVSFSSTCLARVTGVQLPRENINEYLSKDTLVDAVISGDVDALFGVVPGFATYDQLKRVGQLYYCAMAGPAMMARQDSDFIAVWDEGFSKIMANGRYKRLCENTIKKYNLPFDPCFRRNA